MDNPARPATANQANQGAATRPRSLPAAAEERREIDHRLANSLQLAADFLIFEQARLDDPSARTALMQAAARLTAVAERHRFHEQPAGCAGRRSRTLPDRALQPDRGEHGPVLFDRRRAGHRLRGGGSATRHRHQRAGDETRPSTPIPKGQPGALHVNMLPRRHHPLPDGLRRWRGPWPRLRRRPVHGPGHDHRQGRGATVARIAGRPRRPRGPVHPQRAALPPTATKASRSFAPPDEG